MNNQEILKLYKIEMINIHTRADIDARKTFLGGGDMESFFDLSLNDVDTIENEVIPIINHFINGNSSLLNPEDVEFGGIDYFVRAYPDGVFFFDPVTNRNAFDIPLEHFKIICIEWMNFLRTS